MSIASPYSCPLRRAPKSGALRPVSGMSAGTASVIGFIRDVHGRQALRNLVAAYADGATCEGGVQRVLTMSLERLEDQWLASRLPRSALAVFWDENGAWVLLLLLLVGVPGLFILPIRMRTSQPGSN